MRRLVRAAFLSLLLGAMASLGLAISAGLRLLPDGSATSTMVIDLADDPNFGFGWMLQVDERWFACISRGRALVAPGTYGIHGDGTIELALVEGDPELRRAASARQFHLPFIMPAGGGVDDVPPEVMSLLQAANSGGGTLLAWPFERQVGWPVPCMRYSIANAGGWNRGTHWWGTPVEVVGGWSAGPLPGGGRLDLRVIPLKVIWSGLVIDAIFFGAIALAIGQGSIALRARRRRGAGRCVICGYDLAGAATCSECGTATRGQWLPPTS